ncbi:MAG: polyhydroxyalkanoate synthesis regulator DNA-binding domain-containing protein [Myxococcota bacterium]
MPVIKKYENRRLYDTSASRYVNLEDLARIVAEGQELVVTDVKTGRDLTRDVLLQLVTEGDDDAAALPTELLRRIIRTRGADPMARLLREQLLLGLELLEAQLAQSEAYLAGMYPPSESGPMVVRDRDPLPYEPAPPTPPFGRLPPEATAPPMAKAPVASPELPPDPAWKADPAGAEELTALREELARLEARLKR